MTTSRQLDSALQQPLSQAFQISGKRWSEVWGGLKHLTNESLVRCEVFAGNFVNMGLHNTLVAGLQGFCQSVTTLAVVAQSPTINVFFKPLHHMVRAIYMAE